MIDWPEKERYTAEDLVEIIRILRRPEGCPWDKVQTHQSIRKNFLEETCEVLEAIDADDPRMLREELGDVLMQVAFHAVLEEEQGRSTFEEICREVCEKLVYRHPHVFASAAGQNAGINGWDALKNKEKGRRDPAGPDAGPEAAKAGGALRRRPGGAGGGPGRSGPGRPCLAGCRTLRRRGAGKSPGGGGDAVRRGGFHPAGGPRCRGSSHICIQGVLRGAGKRPGRSSNRRMIFGGTIL